MYSMTWFLEIRKSVQVGQRITIDSDTLFCIRSLKIGLFILYSTPMPDLPAKPKTRKRRRGFVGNDHVPSVPANPQYLEGQVTPDEIVSTISDLRDQLKQNGVDAQSMAKFWADKLQAKTTKYFAHEGVVKDEREMEALDIQVQAGKEINSLLGWKDEQGKDGSRQNIIVITNISRD